MQVLLKELFTTDVGLMSAAVIAITLGMAGYYAWYFRSHMKNDQPPVTQSMRCAFRPGRQRVARSSAAPLRRRRTSR